MLRQDDFLKSQLVTMGWLYGKEYGGHLASCMIMNTIANRVRCGWGSWLEIIERIPLFAAENEQPKGLPPIWDTQFVRLLHEVEPIYDGSAVDISKGALYWCDLRRIERDWFREKILEQSEIHNKVADMNSLCFFK
jgi:hypothetical protein